MRASFVGLGGGLVLCAALIATTAAATQLAELSVACNEATEPLRMIYGEYATGCAISPSIDLDRFAVAATAGETLQITLESTTGSLDPHVKIRDPLGANELWRKNEL